MTQQSPAVAHLVAEATANALDGAVHQLESAVQVLSAYGQSQPTPPVRALRERLHERSAPSALVLVQKLIGQLGEQLAEIESGRKP